MYYEPKHFIPEELLSKAVFKRERDNGNQIWRLFDGRLLWTIDAIRERFCGPKKHPTNGGMIMNDWAWGGHNQYRGFRDIFVDIVTAGNNFSRTTQHAFGRGADYVIGQVNSEDVIQDIKDNPDIDAYQFITGLELGTTWVHNDVRCWDRAEEGIFTFNR